jgi:hypothetical protein
MSVQNILDDAEKLRTNRTRTQLLTLNIEEILRVIRNEISDAHSSGRHEIQYNLPITFVVPQMTNTDAQRYVWGSIIDILLSKNYKVQIEFEKSRCTLFISWLTREDEKLDYFDRLIVEHSVDRIIR